MLKLVAMGLSNHQIEIELFLSPNSVKSHLRAAYSKIGVASRTLAVIWCYEHGPVMRSGRVVPPV